MIKDDLIKLYNDLGSLNPNKLTLVTLDDNHLTIKQLKKTIILSYLDLYYFRDKKFKYGLLTQLGLNKLQSTILDLIQSPKFDDQSILTCPNLYSIDFYELVPERQLIGPQLRYNLKLVNIKSRFYTKWLLKHSDAESKLLISLLK